MFAVAVLLLAIIHNVFTQAQHSACPESRFGWKCRFDCACQEGSCDPVTGGCLSGCKKGRYGVGCQLVDECLYDTRGAGYMGSINVTSKGENCEPWETTLQVLGRQLVFAAGDNPQNFCRNPQDKDGNTADAPWCYVSLNKTIIYSTCSQLSVSKCPVGLFGKTCSSFCHCRHTDEDCNKHRGACQTGCDIGWKGLNCQTPCDTGSFGLNCEERCENCHQGACHPETGDCVKGCNTGLRGDNCSETCIPGTFGDSCAGQCGQCKDGEPCHPITGICFRGCAQGFTGQLCGQRYCPRGFYGKNCSETCNCTSAFACHQHTGTCLSLAALIIVEDPLKTLTSHKVLVPVCVVAVIVIVVVAVIAVIKLRQRHERKYREHEKKILDGALISQREPLKPPHCRMSDFDDNYESA